jgi:hypothetical protein
MYDLIGDIHGHADELVRLLEVLGYHRTNGSYIHSNRQVIFLGDFIDRGPEIRRTLQVVRGMVEAGAALSVLGNHELNALAFHSESPDQPGEYLRPRSSKNVRQHRQTLEQMPSGELTDYLEWFRTLPAWLDLPGLRVVHACWNEEAMSLIEHAREEHDGITTPFLRRAYDHDDGLFDAVEIVLKGQEAALPEGVSFVDKDGQERRTTRTRWYLPAEGHSYRTYGLQSDEIACDAPLLPEVVAAARPYPSDAKPVFVGHYWLWAERPSLLAPNVACLDYSVAKGGFLTAYRWDGETRLDDRKFVTVRAG